MTFQFFVRDANAGFGTIDVATNRIRLGGVPGFTTRAEQGTVGMSSVEFDDPAGNIDFLNGLVHVFAAETACTTSRMFYGFTTTRGVSSAPGTSLIVNPARRWNVSIADLNAFLACRVCRPSGGSSRPAETDIERITWLLGSPFMLNFVFDNGWIDATNPVDLDANDYTGQTPDSVLRDCSNASGKNYYLYYDETVTLGEEIGLVYQYPTSTLLASTIRLTNVLSAATATPSTTFVVDSVKLDEDPQRVYDAVLLVGNGLNYYQSQGLLGVVPRDAVIQAPNISTQTAAQAQVTRYLDETATPDERISCTVRLPRDKVNLLKAGMRVSVYFANLPGYDDPGFTGIACVSQTVAQVETSDQFYTVSLELCDLKLMGVGQGAPGLEIVPPQLTAGCSLDTVNDDSATDANITVAASATEAGLVPVTVAGTSTGYLSLTALVQTDGAVADMTIEIFGDDGGGPSLVLATRAMNIANNVGITIAAPSIDTDYSVSVTDESGAGFEILDISLAVYEMVCTDNGSQSGSTVHQHAIDSFIGDGATTAFTTTFTPMTGLVAAYTDGVRRGVAVVGSTVTFDTAPLLDAEVFLDYPYIPGADCGCTLARDVGTTTDAGPITVASGVPETGLVSTSVPAWSNGKIFEFSVTLTSDTSADTASIGVSVVANDINGLVFQSNFLIGATAGEPTLVYGTDGSYAADPTLALDVTVTISQASGGPVDITDLELAFAVIDCCGSGA